MHLLDWVGQVQTIAKEAGRIILAVYNSEEDWGVQLKSDDSPVTKADLLSNEFICHALENIDPNIPVVSEEKGQYTLAQRRQFDYWWVVDPLDGTKEFLARNGEFSVNIALMKGAYPVLGVLYAPFRQEMYWAVQHQGAYQLVDGENHRLFAGAFILTEKGLKVFCSRSHLDAGTQQYVHQLNAPELQPLGSALKLPYIAAGKGHLYPRIAPVHEWDIAAGQIILEEAGGAVLEYPGHQRLAYQRAELKLPAFVAYGKLLDPLNS